MGLIQSFTENSKRLYMKCKKKRNKIKQIKKTNRKYSKTSQMDCDPSGLVADIRIRPWLDLSSVQGKEECVLLILEKLSDTSLINATNAALQTWVTKTSLQKEKKRINVSLLVKFFSVRHKNPPIWVTQTFLLIFGRCVSGRKTPEKLFWQMGRNG